MSLQSAAPAENKVPEKVRFSDCCQSPLLCVPGTQNGFQCSNCMALYGLTKNEARCWLDA